MLAAAHPLSATRQNLWRLTFIRILVLAAQAGSVGVAYWTELVPLPWLSLAITLALSSLLCAFTALRLRLSLPVTELEYALQLACDLLIHSALLYYSGGSTNPFVSYYLVPLASAAVTLPWIYSLVLSGIALVAYSLLLVQFYPLLVGRPMVVPAYASRLWLGIPHWDFAYRMNEFHRELGLDTPAKVRAFEQKNSPTIDDYVKRVGAQVPR